MIKYHKQEMVYDCKRDKDVIVFDTNKLLIMDVGTINKRIKVEFPEVIKMLTLNAVNDNLFPGEAYVIKVRGFTIVALITQIYISGRDIDDGDTVDMFTTKAIDNMIKKIGSNLHFVSGILNRKVGKWNSVAYHILNKQLNWTVYTE